MKKNILIAIALITLINPFILHGQGYNIDGCRITENHHVLLGNNDDSYDLQEIFSEISDTAACVMIDYGDLIDVWEVQNKQNKGMGSMSVGATSGDGTCNGFNYQNYLNPKTCLSYRIGWEINNLDKTFTYSQKQEIDLFLKNVISTGVFSPKLFGELIFSFSNTDYFNELFQIRINLSHSYALKNGAYTESFTIANIKHNIDVWVPTKMKYIKQENFVCNIAYPITDLFTGIYNPVNNPLLENLTGNFNCSDCGNDINNFLDFSNNTMDFDDYLIEYKGSMKLFGKSINYIYKKKINVFSNIYEPLWEDVPIGLHEGSSAVPLDAYTNNITSPFLAKEFVGSGVYENNNSQWFFSPMSANVGENVIYYRTNYKGCESTWVDTIINVIGLGTSAAPKIDIPYTFSNTSSNDNSIIGLGKHYGGYYDYEGQWEYATGHYYDQYYMSFNYVCGGEKYELSILNPSANLEYEWNVYYHDELLTTGVGDFFTLQIPSNDSLVTNNTFQPINIEDADSTSTYSYIGYSGYMSNYLGDIIKVKVRTKNVLGDYSNWSKFYLFGAVSSPELITQDVFCSETDLHEVSITEYSNNSAYISFNDLSNYRTISYEKNLQGDWINYDSIHNYTSPTSVKIDTITVIAKDSIKFYGFNKQLNEWKSIYHPVKSTVCYSEPQTYVFVRKPEFEVNFNEYDTITYGNAVKGEIVGSYFDDSTKYLWNWNDGSETYNEQVHWHFFNDLGSYSVNVDVIDSYGCSNSLYFDSLWFVPGVLALEEEIDEVEFSVYPNPTSESFKIKSNYSFDNVEIYNIQGILVSSFDYLSNYSYNISSLSSGVYTIKINGSIGKYILKLIKK